MIDTSKLKYYKTLCEKGVVDEQQNDLDDIMNTLEEKQFEYLKRLETTKDESRKDEINELLNIIDLQLKELAAIKTTVSSGIIIANEKKEETYKSLSGQSEDYSSNTRKGVDEGTKKGIKIGVIIASAIALVLVLGITIGVVLNRSSERTSDIIETEDDYDDVARIGFNTFTTDEVKRALLLGGEEEAADSLLGGPYIYDISNLALLKEGLKLGDRIISLNGETANDDDEFMVILQKFKPGDTAVLVVGRGSEQFTIETPFITVEERMDTRNSGEEIIEIEGYQFLVQYGDGGAASITLKK